jgi:hypothetical protein
MCRITAVTGVYYLLGCDVMWSGRYLPIFQRNNLHSHGYSSGLLLAGYFMAYSSTQT